MKFLKQLFNFYIYSSIHVSLAVFSLSWITLLEFGISYDKSLLYFIFFASISGYNFVKYFGMAKFHHRKLATWLKAIQLFSFCSFLLMCYYLFKLQEIAYVGILSFGIITFFYAMPLLPRNFLPRQQNLRNIGGIKVYLIAFVWSGVTVILPVMNNYFVIDTYVILTFIQRFIFVIVLMIPFEIRDLRYDSQSLKTIPQKIGLRNTKMMGVMLLLVFFAIEFFKTNTGKNQIIVLFILIITTIWLVVNSRTNQGKYYSSFFVEGLPILWLLFALLSC